MNRSPIDFPLSPNKVFELAQKWLESMKPKEPSIEEERKLFDQVVMMRIGMGKDDAVDFAKKVIAARRKQFAQIEPADVQRVHALLGDPVTDISKGT